MSTPKIELAHARLSDEEIKRIYSNIPHSEEIPEWLHSFADAIVKAETRGDFILLRPTAVVFIAKYSLGCHLVATRETA